MATVKETKILTIITTYENGRQFVKSSILGESMRNTNARGQKQAPSKMEEVVETNETKSLFDVN